MTAVLLGGTALVGTLAGGALAQDNAQPAAKKPAEAGAETVTVTAQRRTQNILDVPYNISAVSGQTIEQQSDS